jgi:hypothetical protein
MKKPPGKGKKTTAVSPPTASLPLPLKGEKRHGDAKKFRRPREKERLHREIEVD